MNKNDNDNDSANEIIEEVQVGAAINWSGGRHHSHSDKSGGLCYVNDVVLAIQNLIKVRAKRIDPNTQQKQQ